ncbi:hypothetical protein YC2023_010039 [Brassica napus]
MPGSIIHVGSSVHVNNSFLPVPPLNQLQDNNHAKQIVEISPALEHNLEVDVHHLSAPKVDRDDTENLLDTLTLIIDPSFKLNHKPLIDFDRNPNSQINHKLKNYTELEKRVKNQPSGRRDVRIIRKRRVARVENSSKQRLELGKKRETPKHIWYKQHPDLFSANGQTKLFPKKSE